MSQANGLNRRAFLRNAGLTALAGATAGTSTTLIASTPAATGQEPTNGKFDFDTVYNRFGTDSTKFDQQIRLLREGQRAGRHGHRRHRLQGRAVDHQGDQRSRQARELGLSRHGGVDAQGDRGRRRVEQAPLRRDHRSEHDGAVQRRAPGDHRRAQHVQAERVEGVAADADLQRLLQRPHRDRRPRPRKARSSSSTGSSRWTSTTSSAASATTPTRSCCAIRRTRPATAGRRKICCASARSASSTA